jgi:ParB-like chromosome segregation protein Spo0J
MKIVRKKLSDLHPAERNVRIHSEKQTREFVRSLESFGQIRPIVIDEDNTILAGNGLYAALMAKGESSADCYVVSGLTENEKKKLMLADNKIYSLGVDDMEVFEEFLKELGDDLEIPGYDEELLKTITADMEDVDEMLSGYGTVTESTKQQIGATAEKYEAQEAVHAQGAEEIKPANPAAEPADNGHGDPLPKRFIQCPECGNKIWL